MPTSRLRLKPAVSLLVLGVIGAVVAFAVIAPALLRRSTSNTEPQTLDRLQERLRDLDERDPAAAVDLLIDYAGFISEIGDLQRAHDATSQMLDASPDFAASPKIVEKRREMDQAVAKGMERYGLDPAAGWKPLLSDGLDLGRRVLDRSDLSAEQRSAAGVARARILYQAGQYDRALALLDAAGPDAGNAVMIHLLRGDIYVQQKQYDPAIEQYRAASMALTNWANDAPPLSVRLANAVLSGSARARRRERQDRERRQRAAEGLRHVIASQVSVVQGLQRLEDRRP